MSDNVEVNIINNTGCDVSIVERTNPDGGKEIDVVVNSGDQGLNLISQLRLDGARLDWLESNPRDGQIIIDGRLEPCIFYAVSGAPGVSLRDIIDAVMASKGGLQ